MLSYLGIHLLVLEGKVAVYDGMELVSIARYS